MPSLLGKPCAHFSAELVGRVLPPVPFDHYCSEVSTAAQGHQPTMPKKSSMIDPPPHKTKASSKRKVSDYYKTPVRRQQCRDNQARYRNNERQRQLHLEKSVEQLRQEVGNLKRRYQDLSSRERSNQSPWSIVVEVFRLVQSGFRSPWRMTSVQEMKNHKETRQALAALESSFVHDVALDSLRGVRAAIEQLRRYSQYFADPTIQLRRVEAVAPGVMAAMASVGLTISELSLQNWFPRVKSDCDRQRLLGQRLELNCWITFLFDEESGRVVRMEVAMDWITALTRALESTKDAVAVLEHARITPECSMKTSTEP